MRRLLDRRALGFTGALLSAVGTVEDIGLGYFIVAVFHEFLLDEILNVFDVDEGLFEAQEMFSDFAGDVDSGPRVLVEGEKGFADGDFDFVGIPGNDVAVAADEAEIRGLVGRSTAVKEKALGDVVSTVFDKGLFDGEMDVVVVYGRIGLALSFRAKDLLGSAGNGSNKFAVGGCEDVFPFTGDEEVSKGTPNGVCDLAEVAVACVAIDYDLDRGLRVAVVFDSCTPIELRFLKVGGIGNALQCLVFLEVSIWEHLGRRDTQDKMVLEFVVADGSEVERGSFLVFGDAAFKEILLFFDIHEFSKPGKRILCTGLNRGKADAFEAAVGDVIDVGGEVFVAEAYGVEGKAVFDRFFRGLWLRA